jgi:hypothetical protein
VFSRVCEFENVAYCLAALVDVSEIVFRLDERNFTFLVLHGVPALPRRRCNDCNNETCQQ